MPSPLAAAAYAGHLAHPPRAGEQHRLRDRDRVRAQGRERARLGASSRPRTQTLVIFMGVRKLDSLMQLLIAHGRAPELPGRGDPVGVAAVAAHRRRHGRDIAAARARRRARHAGADGGRRGRAAARAAALVRHASRCSASACWSRAPRSRREALAQLLRDAGADAGARRRRSASRRRTTPRRCSARSSAGRRLRLAGVHERNGVRRVLRRARARRAATRARSAACASRRSARPPPKRCGAHGIVPDVVPGRVPRRGAGRSDRSRAHGGAHAGRARAAARAPRSRATCCPNACAQRARTSTSCRPIAPLPPSRAERARLRELIERGEIDALTFTSSSTLEHTLDALGRRRATPARAA